MDASAFRNFPIGGLLVFAAIGVVLSIVLGIGAVGGLVWFVIHHLRIV